jgi:cytochrome c551/c552
VQPGSNLGPFAAIIATHLRRAHRASRHSRIETTTFLLAASLLLAGCGSKAPETSTAPEATTIVDTVNTSSAMPAATDLAVTTSLGGPLRGLNAAELARFDAGLDEFQDDESLEEGLGPVFNESSCVTCHNAPVGGTTGRSETRFGRTGAGGFDPLAELGGSLLQDHAIGLVSTPAGSHTFAAEAVPASANVTAQRITTPLFGLGLVDAVPDGIFFALARLEAIYAPTTAGRPNLVTEIRTGATRVGRFGWKAQVPTLHQFAGDAYLNEMGVTSPEFPVENAPQGDASVLAFNPKPEMNDDGGNVEGFFDFMTLLGAPPRGQRSLHTERGAVVFRQIGCANCHTPTLVTGASPVRALSYKAFQPYSDFLLHDMGALGDGISQGTATGRTMRTAPLWGLSTRPTFLHDGRAATPEAAILAHAGQGSAARDRYTRLTAGARFALLAFVRSL